MKSNLFEDYSLLISSRNDNEKKINLGTYHPTSNPQIKKSLSPDIYLPLIDSSNSKNFIKSYKPKIISAINSTIRELDSQNTDSRSIRTSPCSMGKTRTNSLRSLQQKNLKKIKQEEKNQAEAAFNKFKTSVSQEKYKVSEHKKSETAHSSIQKMGEIQKFLRKKSLDESETSDFLLDNLNKKIQKSMFLYQDILEKKKMFALNNSNKRAYSVNVQNRVEEQALGNLTRLISKSKVIENRKKKCLKYVQEEMSKKREFFQKKIEKVKEFARNSEKSEWDKQLEIENRIKVCEDLVGNHKKSVERVKKQRFDQIRDKEALTMKNFLKNTEKQ